MKRFLLSAVVLLSVGLNAQETGGVGINTENPQATLDVNGDARLQKVELMTTSTPTEEVFSDCPCVLTIDKKGVIMRIPKEKFVLTDGSTNSGTPATTYSSTKSYTATGVYKNQNCGSGKVAENYTVSHTETITLTSKKSQEDADTKALDEATRLAKQWVKDHGQDEANVSGVCRNENKVYSTRRVCLAGRYVKDVYRSGKYDVYRSKGYNIATNSSTGSTVKCSSALADNFLRNRLDNDESRVYLCRYVGDDSFWGTPNGYAWVNQSSDDGYRMCEE